MTCIVGIRRDGKVFIGGDSAGTDRYGSQRTRADDKVFVSQGFAFGFTSSYRYNLKPPTPREGVEPAEFMTTEFIDAVREVLKTGGYAKVENGVERGGSFIVGWRGELYHVEHDFQVGVVTDEHVATGSGVDLALGSLWTTERDRKLTVRRRIHLALGAAEQYDAYVRGPFKIVSVG